MSNMQQFYGEGKELQTTYNLTTVRELDISLVPAGAALAVQPGQPVPKYAIRTVDGQEILRGNQLRAANSLRAVELADTSGNTIRKIAYRMGVPSMSVCFPNDAPLGELEASVLCFLCFGARIKYSLRLQSGKTSFVLSTFFSPCCICCMIFGGMHMTISGENGEDVGLFKMGGGTNLLSVHCELKFTSDASTDEDRKTILALCLGLLDEKLEKDAQSQRIDHD